MEEKHFIHRNLNLTIFHLRNINGILLFKKKITSSSMNAFLKSAVEIFY